MQNDIDFFGSEQYFLTHIEVVVWFANIQIPFNDKSNNRRI